MLKILQVRLQQYMNLELRHVQAGFLKGRRTRDQIANICWIVEKAREFQKNIYFCFTEYTSLNTHLIVLIATNWKILQKVGIPDHLSASWEISVQVKKQQLESDMEQQTSSKFGKVYVKAVYCHSAYLT